MNKEFFTLGVCLTLATIFVILIHVAEIYFVLHNGKQIDAMQEQIDGRTVRFERIEKALKELEEKR